MFSRYLFVFCGLGLMHCDAYRHAISNAVGKIDQGGFDVDAIGTVLTDLASKHSRKATAEMDKVGHDAEAVSTLSATEKVHSISSTMAVAPVVFWPSTVGAKDGGILLDDAKGKGFYQIKWKEKGFTNILWHWLQKGVTYDEDAEGKRFRGNFLGFSELRFSGYIGMNFDTKYILSVRKCDESDCQGGFGPWVESPVFEIPQSLKSGPLRSPAKAAPVDNTKLHMDMAMDAIRLAPHERDAAIKAGYHPFAHLISKSGHHRMLLEKVVQPAVCPCRCFAPDALRFMKDTEVAFRSGAPRSIANTRANQWFDDYSRDWQSRGPYVGYEPLLRSTSRRTFREFLVRMVTEMELMTQVAAEYTRAHGREFACKRMEDAIQSLMEWSIKSATTGQVHTLAHKFSSVLPNSR